MQVAKLVGIAITAATAVIAVVLYRQGLWWQSAWAFIVMLVSAAIVGSLFAEHERMREHHRHAHQHHYYTRHPN